MPKNVRLESFKYHLLLAIERSGVAEGETLNNFIDTLEFSQVHRGEVQVSWTAGPEGSLSFPLEAFEFYTKGDTEASVGRQRERDLVFQHDIVSDSNERNFRMAVDELMMAAGLDRRSSDDNGRLQVEEEFHDQWADAEDPEKIDVKLINQALTAPEMRYIHERLGNIKGKKLLDVGSGLGEASVYFAMQGADVTATDLSARMLRFSQELAEKNRVEIALHKASAEGLGLPEGTTFDIIYTGNLLHHVDVEKTITELKGYLAAGGTLVSWDPLVYNPAINVYRKKATQVRTPDEHPLTWADLKLFDAHFTHVYRRYFWLSTLFIFVIMGVLQRRDPNKERYWKSVITESDRWSPIYRPLELLDRFLLKAFPPLRLMCWNVVVFAEK